MLLISGNILVPRVSTAFLTAAQRQVVFGKNHHLVYVWVTVTVTV